MFFIVHIINLSSSHSLPLHELTILLMFLLQVVVKDFISKAIVSQFRAHTSPISALCFDPTGTLLVTASVHGHNINVFRIMPSRVQNASDSACYDWSSSHVHLFKLYRGLTAAVSSQCFPYLILLMHSHFDCSFAFFCFTFFLVTGHTRHLF